MNTPGSPSQSIDQPLGQSLGLSLWQRHTQTALNRSMHAGDAGGFGTSIHDRHTAFVASLLRRVSSNQTTGADGQSRPVVIGRRAHIDPESPESFSAEPYVAPRAHVVPQAGPMSRGDAGADDAQARAPARPNDAPPPDVIAVPVVDPSGRAADPSIATTRDGGQRANPPQSAAPEPAPEPAPGPAAAAINRVDAVHSVERLAGNPVVTASEHAELAKAAGGHGGIDRAPETTSGAVPDLRAGLSKAVGSKVDGKAAPQAITTVSTGRRARGALAFRQAADALQSVTLSVPGPITMPKPVAAVLWAATQHALARTPEGAEAIPVAQSVSSAARVAARYVAHVMVRGVSHKVPPDMAQRVPHEVARGVRRKVPHEVAYQVPHETAHGLRRKVANDLPHEVQHQVPDEVPYAVMRRGGSSPADVVPLSQRPLAIAMRVGSNVAAASEVFRASVHGNPGNAPLLTPQAPSQAIPARAESRAERVSPGIVGMPSIAQKSVDATVNHAPAEGLIATEPRIYDAQAPIDRATSSDVRHGVGALDADESVSARVKSNERMHVAPVTAEAAAAPVEAAAPHRLQALAADRMRETPGPLAARAAARFSTTHAHAIVSLLRSASVRSDEPRAAAAKLSQTHGFGRTKTQVPTMPSVVQREQGVERALAMRAFDPVQDRTPSPVIDRSPERTKTDTPALTVAPALYAGAPLLRAVAINRISASDHADGELTRGLAPDATALTDHMDQVGQADHTRHSVPADLPSISTPSKQPVQTSTHADPVPAIHARVERQLQLARVQAAEPVRSSLTTATQLAHIPQPMDPHAGSHVPNLLRVFATSVPWAARAADTDSPAQTASSSPVARSGTSGQDNVGRAATIDSLADQYGVVPVDTQRAGPSPGGTHRPAPNASETAKTGKSAAGNAIDASELAEQAWQIIQDKLAVERERRGFASWP